MVDTDYALFAAIVEAGSLSAAGRAFGLSPAMTSKRLARLEARLGVRLVHRTTRRLALTEIGARLHADITPILDQLRLAEDRVSGAVREPVGILRVSLPTSFGRLHVAPQLHAFMAAYPRVELDVTLSDAFADMVAERVDVAVRITATLPSGLVAHRLADSPRILCASPRYLAAHGTPGSINDLADHRLLAANGQLPWRLLNGRRRATIDRRSAVCTNSSELVRELALTHVGVALRSLWDVGEAIHRGDLVQVLPGWEGSRDVGIYALHHSGTVAASVRAFTDFLQTLLDPVPWTRDLVRPKSTPSP